MYEYPFGNGQQLNLDWFLAEWKNLLAAWEAEKNGIEGALQAEIDRAEAALADVFSARDAAAQSATNALESKNAAAQSASDASGYLATVRADANTASNAAQNAAQSESNAAESAQTALASKNNAANSERNAAQSEANANSSKNAAAQSAADALAHKDAAAQSAADALANKNAAAQSAEDASDAAASIEASAQQITTNANDISDLKESINQESSSIITNIFKGLFLSEGETAYNGRVVKRNRNKITVSRTSYGGNSAIHSLTGNAFLIENTQNDVLDYAEELYNNGCFVDFPLIYGQAQIVIETIATGIRNSGGYITFITRREGETPAYHYINSTNISDKMYNASAFTTEMMRDLKTEGAKICIVAYLQGGFQGNTGDAFIETSAVIKLPDTSSLALALSN